MNTFEKQKDSDVIEIIQKAQKEYKKYEELNSLNLDELIHAEKECFIEDYSQRNVNHPLTITFDTF